MAKRGALLSLLVLFLAGCQSATEPESPAKFSDADKLIGSYRLKATPDEVAESGGLDNLPLLVIDKGFFRLVIDKEESTGGWQLKDGKLLLTDKESKETNAFSVSSDGTELMEDNNDPLVFVKVGVQPPPKSAR
ncbi:MAG: hypothetical protein JNM28_07320 [Armatimonadetes bacterium]|nr:hypothetical protein [Armatimonadota bacterium]MBS1711818.1 hypothetical protein [Armatimonadota bacterium]MBX3109628.1 hypothetical protein [Fimbriimonadaceae bacterium]